MPQTIPEVSIVIPAFNVEDYIGECLDSIIEQTLTNFECIVIDDGSTDRTVELVEKYALKDSRITLVRQKRAGQSVARNTGLDRALGEYIIFLDSDDWFHKDLLKLLYKCSSKLNDIVIYNMDIYHNVTKSFDRKIFNFKDVPKKQPFSYKDMPDRILTTFGPNVVNKFFRRKFLITHNIKFVEKIHRAEDRLFATETLVLAKRISVLDKSLYYYRRGLAGSSTATLNQYPTEFYVATYLEKEILERHGVYKKVERSFKNSILDNLRGILIENEVHKDSLQIVYTHVVKLLNELHYLDHKANYFFNKTDYDLISAIIKSGYSDYLQNRIIQLRSHENFLTERLELTEARRVNDNKNLEQEIKKLNMIITRLRRHQYVRNLLRKYRRALKGVQQ